ncbi:cyanate transporter [Citrobacter amalonaticus]|uniref:Cyanate transporter n=1 Tax=Citrobacter amalonaticus TaxID=35703 RepID=A0A2S4S3S6_CITAM|nr:cyanate transporter [Citrobacter amalonaticus]POT59906.1 cyanate transporter [Citrobacter amalonaticus]POT78037.1 cyanate transporter [Citrobacter amalonaticus]POU68489.1 cyanate transporter [Citrobacter amalonaticus]POV08092.1 cyanate transporter [Citrobacter amalonaticus]
MNKSSRPVLMLLVLVLIGLNMRPLLTSVGPLLPQLRAASGMSFAVASLLTALPMIAMGLLALAGGWITLHIRERNSVALSLLMIASGALLRELAPHSGLLLSSALLGGIGIGVIQVVMPTVIKRLFPRRMPQVMGLWSAALMGGGGLGAALTPWFARHSEVWHQSLAWWALPAMIALFGWWMQSRTPETPHHSAATSATRIVLNPRAWTLGLYFGVINGGYGSLIAWLPPYYIQQGESAQFSGTLLALMTVGQTAGALILPMLARHRDRRKLLLFALALQLTGFCGFILWPAQLPILWAVTCGIGLGGAFPLCLVLALDHASHPAISGKLVAFMQGIGFIIAGLSPYLSGILRSKSGDFLLDWTFHAVCVAALMLLTLRFIPARYPQEWSVTE